MHSGRLRVGLNAPVWPSRRRPTADWPEIRELARDAEAIGVDTIWVPDQLQIRRRDGTIAGFWECWTMLSALAAVTNSVAIGSLIVCTGFRPPALLAKMATTLDAIAGGRLILGLGAGAPDFDEGWRAYGFDATEPVARFEEAVEVVARLLREGSLSFEGRFNRVEGAELVPRGPRAAGPPVWIASDGARTGRIAARWADAINIATLLTTRDDALRAMERIDVACRTVGRDRDTLQVTALARVEVARHGGPARTPRAATIGGSSAAVVEQLLAIHDAGVDHITCYVGDEDDGSPYPALTRDALERFEPVIESIVATGERTIASSG